MAGKIQIRSNFPTVPYLKSEIINKFGNLIVKTADRLEFKINSLILVSVSQLFKKILKNIYDDAHEVVILSEFDSSDLKNFRDFIMEGVLPKNPKCSKTENIFQSFGIDLNMIINGKHFENILDPDEEIKIEVIEEDDLLEVAPEISNIFHQTSTYDHDEEIDAFDELFEADYKNILSKTQNSFGEIIDKVENDDSAEAESLNEKSIKLQNNLDHQTDKEEENGVERIIDKNYDVKGQVHYLIKWKNYEEKDNTWEPIDSLYCKKLIEEFEISYEANNDFLDKFRKNSQKNFRKILDDDNDDFWPEPDQGVKEFSSENENSVKIRKSSRKRKQKYLGNEFETLMNFDENESKKIIKDDDQPYKPDQEDENEYENSINEEIIDTSSQITGLRKDLKGLIGYRELCKFKEELKNNFDVKIPPPDFTLEDYKNFVFPKPLEELEVIPSILAEHKYVVPTPGNSQCGVCGSFGLNNYPNIKHHHTKYHAIHYACPIDDCG